MKHIMTPIGDIPLSAFLNLSVLKQRRFTQILRSLSLDYEKNDVSICFGFIFMNQDVVSRVEFDFVTFPIEKAF